MKVFIVYCHPSENSFTAMIRDQFIKGLESAGHTYKISDLYKMGFDTDFSEEEYLRDGFYRDGGYLDEDVEQEQEKIQGSDAIVFIYPVFWTEAPAKLVGWFDRVWTYGFAYGKSVKMKVLKKVICLVTAGKTTDDLVQSGEMKAMETVMLGDRIKYRAAEKSMYFFTGMTRWNMEQREKKLPEYIEQAFQLGADIDK